MRALYICLFSFFCISYSKAQVSFNNLDEVWSYLQKNNADLVSSQISKQMATYELKQAYTYLLPKVVANGTYTDNLVLQTTLIPAGVFGVPTDTYIPVQFGQKYIANGGLTAQMDLFNLPMFYNIKKADLQKEYASNQVAINKYRVYEQAANTYFSYLLVKKAIELLEKNDELVSELATSSENKMKEGLIKEYLYNKVIISQKIIQQKLAENKAQLLILENTLRQLLNMKDIETLEIKEKLEVSPSENISVKFAVNPNLVNYELKKRESLVNGLIARADFFPVLSLSGTFNYQQNSQTFKLFDNNTTWYSQKFITLRASWTLFSGGGRILQWKKNNMQLEQAKLLLENSQKQVQTEEINLNLELAKNKESLKKSEEIMQLQNENYQHRVNQFNEGQISLDEKNDDFMELINYQNNYFDDLSRYLISVYKVKLRAQDF